MNNKIEKWYGLIIFIIIVGLCIGVSTKFVLDRVNEIKQITATVAEKERRASELAEKVQNIQNTLKAIKQSMLSAKKKIYSPTDSNLGDDTLFFTLYSDLLEMLHANSIKVRAIDYVYNPENDVFVTAGNNMYFVCRINMELVSNYIDMGKFIQALYQYPYYIKIDTVKVSPYEKDKKILITNMTLTLYARTQPVVEENIAVD